MHHSAAGFGHFNLCSQIKGEGAFVTFDAASKAPRRKKVVITDSTSHRCKNRLKSIAEQHFLEWLIKNHDVYIWHEKINLTAEAPLSTYDAFWSTILDFTEAPAQRDVARTLNEQGLAGDDVIIVDLAKYAEISESLKWGEEEGLEYQKFAVEKEFIINESIDETKEIPQKMLDQLEPLLCKILSASQNLKR